MNGQDIKLPLDAFAASKESHNGGGLIGGLIVYGIYDSFGLLGAYLIDLIVMIVCVIIIIERFAFDRVQRSSQYHADKAAAKRRARRERMMMEREANQTRFNSDRQAVLNRIQEQKELERQQMSQKDGPRRERKYTGITSDTTLSSDSLESAALGDGVDEIRFNMAEGESDLEITKTSRHKLRAGEKKKSSHRFSSEQAAPAIAEPVPPVVSTPVAEPGKEAPFVINTPQPSEPAAVTSAP